MSDNDEIEAPPTLDSTSAVKEGVHKLYFIEGKGGYSSARWQCNRKESRARLMLAVRWLKSAGDVFCRCSKLTFDQLRSNWRPCPICRPCSICRPSQYPIEKIAAQGGNLTIYGKICSL